MENFKAKILGEDQNMSSLADEIKSKVSEYIQNPHKAIEDMNNMDDFTASEILKKCDIDYSRNIISRYNECDSTVQSFHEICTTINAKHSYCTDSIWSNPKVTTLFD